MRILGIDTDDLSDTFVLDQALCQQCPPPARDAGDQDPALPPGHLVDCNGHLTCIRRPRPPGALRALSRIPHPAGGAPNPMVLRGPALVVAHLWMRSSSRHPRLGTDGLERRSRSLRPAPQMAAAVHCSSVSVAVRSA